jgi:tripartite-type tricarboxylate transporter receptor subunit TctC
MRAMRAALAAVALMTVGASAQAQQFPSRDITVICSQAAGSGADVLVRYFASKLSQLAKVNTIVENRPGASTTIAIRHLIQSKPDGHTIYISAGSSLAATPHLLENIPYDPRTTIDFVTTLSRFAFLLAVDAKSPATTVKEMVELQKKKPDHGKYGANAPSSQVAGELLKSLTGLKTVKVGYQDTMTTLNDLNGGQIDFLFIDPIAGVEQMRNGRIRGLAVASERRVNAIPELPSMKEAGVPGLDVDTWWAVMVPNKTPKPVVNKLAELFNQITGTPETTEFLKRNGADPFPGTPESAKKKFDEDYVRWGEYIKLAGIPKQ